MYLKNFQHIHQQNIGYSEGLAAEAVIGEQRPSVESSMAQWNLVQFIDGIFKTVARQFGSATTQ